MGIKWGKKSNKSIFKVFVKPEGEEHYRPTSIWFKNRKKAETFAGIETVAGMGEDYMIKRFRRKKK